MSVYNSKNIIEIDGSKFQVKPYDRSLIKKGLTVICRKNKIGVITNINKNTFTVTLDNNEKINVRTINYIVVKEIILPNTNKTKPQFIMTPRMVSILEGTSIKTIHSDDKNFEKIIEAVSQDNWELVYFYLSDKKLFKEYKHGDIFITEYGEVSVAGHPIFNEMAERLIEMAFTGEEISIMNKLSAFIERLYKNTNETIIDRVFTFMKANDIDITDDGCLVTWKGVRNDYFDIHSGTLDHSVGKTIEVEREKCTTDNDNGFGYGLHSCSRHYLDTFWTSAKSSQKILKMKIAPEDITSISKD